MMKSFVLPQFHFLLFSFVLITACSRQDKTNFSGEHVDELTTTPTETTNSRGYAFPLKSRDYEYFYGADYKRRPDTALQVSEYVRRIFQDKTGNLWFGSNSYGVSRYDGDSLTYFSVKEGLAGAQVTGIIEDKQCNLWFATNGGVSRYDGKEFTNFTTQEGLSNNRVWSIFQDSKGIIWAGTTKGLCRYDGKKFKPFPIPNFPTNVVRCITEDKQGNLWFGMDRNGVSKYNGISFTYISKKDGLGDNHVVCILEDANDNIWFGTMSGGISRYDGNSFTNYTVDNGIDDNEVWTIYEDKAGNIWFSAEGFGVYRYNEGVITNFSKKEGLPIHAVQSIFEDREGRFWIGGGNGLYRKEGISFINITKNGPWGGC